MNTRFTFSILTLFLFLAFTGVSTSQTIFSQFDFNTMPLSTATVGPNGTSVNPNASTSGTGVRFASNGTDVGLNLQVPAASFISSLTSIDIRIEFARNENEAYLIELGELAVYFEGGNLYFKYSVVKNRSQQTERVLGPYSGYTRSASGVYQRIRATYDASTGYGALYVNDSLKLSHQGSLNRELYFGSSSTITIGRIMDGSTTNFATLGSVAILAGGGSALPVELVSFSALKRTDAVELRWNTATELNNYGFDVERSYDKQTWEVLDFVPGSGTVSSPRSYSYRDMGAVNSSRQLVHYRLRQIDRDGTSEHSSVVDVALAGGSSFAVQPAFPNPFNPSTTFTVRLQQDERVTVRVHDASGRVVSTLINGELLSEGVHNITFRADELPSGVYFAIVQTAVQTGSIKLLLQK